MPRRERKYALDTNLFVQSFRMIEAKEALERFHRVFGPFEYLSAIVVQELRAGVQSPVAARGLERYIVRPFARVGRIFAPSIAAWQRAGDVLAALRTRAGGALRRMRRSFANDVLLASSCREQGIMLVTDNARDFDRIARHLDFDFAKPWPGPTA